MATTDHYPLPLPPDSTLIKDMAKIVRESNTAVDAELFQQGERVATAESAAAESARAARAAADLAGTAPDAVVAALVAGEGSATAAALLAHRTAALPGPLKRWGTALRNQKTRAAVWVNTGDSIANGGNPSVTGRQWFNRVAALLGPRPVTRELSGRPANGVQVYNAAVGGLTADNYLTATTIPQIIALQPDLITHLVGTNDYGAGVAPATYKQRLRAKILQLRDATNAVQVIISPHVRYDLANPAHPWAGYLTAMAEIAAEFPADVVYLDMYQHFALMGPLSDSYGVMHPDNLHVDDDGSRVMADIIGAAIGAPAPRIGRKIYQPASVSGGNSSVQAKLFAEIVVPARPWHQQYTFHATVFAYSAAGSVTDVELEHSVGKEPGNNLPELSVIRVTEARQSYSGVLTGTIPPHAEARLRVRYAPNGGSMYIEGGNQFYRSIFADVSPL